jgi:hypothetical protein
MDFEIIDEIANIKLSPSEAVFAIERVFGSNKVWEGGAS